MKLTKYLVSAALAAAILACSPIFAKDGRPTPEERAYEFRHALFETFSWKMGQLYGSKMKEDEAAFTKHAKDLAYLATMIEEGFQIKDGIPKGSVAKPEIWKNFAKFEEKAEAFRVAAAGLTEKGAMADFNPRDFGSKNCGGCHRDFKVKDD
jgi:cytochrome c556